MAPNDRSERKVALAAVAGAHGVTGELRLKLFSDTIESLERHEQLFVAGKPRRLLRIKQSGKTPIARFEGISDRNDAEALRGALIEVERSALPPLDPGEYYHADLIGLSAVDAGGQEVGTVVAVENYGAGDLLEVELPGGKSSLIPFRDGIADLKDGRIIIDTEFLA